jgi:hypothetical protein
MKIEVVLQFATLLFGLALLQARIVQARRVVPVQCLMRSVSWNG